MIKTKYIATVALLALPVLLPIQKVAVAQTKPPAKIAPQPKPVIAIVSFRRIGLNSKAMKRLRKQAQKAGRKLNVRFSGEQTAIRNEFQRLERVRGGLTLREYAQRRRHLQRRVVELRRNSQRELTKLRNAVNRARSKVRNEMVLIVKTIALQRGINLVLLEATTIHASPDFDVTASALQKLDKQMPSVKLGYAPVKKKPAKRKPAKKPAKRKGKK